MEAVAAGNLHQHIDMTGPDDVLGKSVNNMVQSLRNIAAKWR
jgi:hypothetical protein